MAMQRSLVLLVAAAVVSVPAMLLAARIGLPYSVAIMAASFAASAACATVLENLPYWNGSKPGGTWLQLDQALIANGRLIAMAYGWSAIALQGLYLTPLTGLKWQHGWQYACAFGLLATLACEFSRAVRLGDEARRQRLRRLAMPLAMGQGLFAASALVVLVASGKMTTVRADWAANHVFLFSALMVMVVAAVSLRTQSKLTPP